MGLVEDRVKAIGSEKDEGDKAADANFVIDRESNPTLSHPNQNTNRKNTLLIVCKLTCF